MAEEYWLDDRYTTGVWYDQMNGDFAKIQRGVNDDGDRVVELVNPETDKVYWDMSVREWVEDEQGDFMEISEQAVEDPVEVVNRAIRIMSRNDINELSTIPVQEAIDLRYARQQVTIEE